MAPSCVHIAALFCGFQVEHVLDGNQTSFQAVQINPVHFNVEHLIQCVFHNSIKKQQTTRFWTKKNNKGLCTTISRCQNKQNRQKIANLQTEMYVVYTVNQHCFDKRQQILEHYIM